MKGGFFMDKIIETLNVLEEFEPVPFPPIKPPIDNPVPLYGVEPPVDYV